MTKLQWRGLIAMVIWMVFGQSSVLAIDCEEMTRKSQEGEQGSTYSEIVVVGVLHDTRSHGIAEETLSERDRTTLTMSAMLGQPVLLEEGTNKLHVLGPLGLGNVPEAVQILKEAQRFGPRVRVTGCISEGGGGWLLIDTLNDVEPLE